MQIHPYFSLTHSCLTVNIHTIALNCNDCNIGAEQALLITDILLTVNKIWTSKPEGVLPESVGMPVPTTCDIHSFRVPVCLNTMMCSQRCCIFQEGTVHNKVHVILIMCTASFLGIIWEGSIYRHHRDDTIQCNTTQYNAKQQMHILKSEKIQQSYMLNTFEQPTQDTQNIETYWAQKVSIPPPHPPSSQHTHRHTNTHNKSKC